MANLSNYFSRPERLQRRSMRLSQFKKVANGFSSRPTNRLTTQNIGSRALTLVHDILGNYILPSRPKLSYSMVRDARVASGNNLEEGVITIHADFHTRTGVQVGIDIPIEVRQGQLSEPSVVIHDGIPRVIAQSTFDGLTTANTFYETLQQREMYAAPFSPQIQKNMQERHIRMERVNQGMFSLKANQDTLRAIVQGKSTAGQVLRWPTDSNCRQASPEDYDADDRYKKPDPDRNIQEGDELDPAERDNRDIEVGEDYSLTEAMEVKERGGVAYDLSKGVKCTVLRDHAGDNKSFVVEFEDGLQAIVERRFLKQSAKNIAPKKLPKDKLDIPKLKGQPKPCKKCQTGTCERHRKKAQSFGVCLNCGWNATDKTWVDMVYNCPDCGNELQTNLNVHTSASNFLDKVSQEVDKLYNQGFTDIDVKLAVRSKYGDEAVTALFNKTAQANSIQIYTGWALDPTTYEDYNFIGRPVRNIKPLTDEQEGFSFELYIHESKQWVTVTSPEEPEFVGVVDDLDDHPTEQLYTHSDDLLSQPTDSPNDNLDNLRVIDQAFSDAQDINEIKQIHRDFNTPKKMRPSDEGKFQYPVVPSRKLSTSHV